MWNLKWQLNSSELPERSAQKQAVDACKLVGKYRWLMHFTFSPWSVKQGCIFFTTAKKGGKFKITRLKCQGTRQNKKGGRHTPSLVRWWCMVAASKQGGRVSSKKWPFFLHRGKYHRTHRINIPMLYQPIFKKHSNMYKRPKNVGV